MTEKNFDAQERVFNLLRELEKEGYNKYDVIQCIFQEDNIFPDQHTPLKERAKLIKNIDIYKNILINELNNIMEFTGEMSITPNMYLKLFNEITDAKVQLYSLAERMEKAQLEVEEIYIRG